MPREDTSRRLKVRRSAPIVARTNQCPASRQISASCASIRCASPRVRRIQVPMSLSLVRSIRIASPSSRASWSGYHAAPSACAAPASAGAGAAGRRQRQVGHARRAIDRDLDGRVAIPVRLDAALQRRQRNTRRARRPAQRRRHARSQRAGTRPDHAREVRGLGQRIDQPPLDRTLAAHAFGGGAEDVRQVAPDAALVGQSRQASRAWKHAEQRHLGQAHRGGTIVDQQDLVAGQRQLVAAAGTGAVDRGEKADAVVRAGVLHAVARLVGELAEVDLPGVACAPEHGDVGAGTEQSLARAGDDHAVHLGMLEADAVERIGELDVDAEVVGVELEPVARLQPGIFGNPQGESRHGTVERELPVPVGVGAHIEAHRRTRQLGRFGWG